MLYVTRCRWENVYIFICLATCYLPATCWNIFLCLIILIHWKHVYQSQTGTCYFFEMNTQWKSFPDFPGRMLCQQRVLNSIRQHDAVSDGDCTKMQLQCTHTAHQHSLHRCCDLLAARTGIFSDWWCLPFLVLWNRLLDSVLFCLGDIMHWVCWC